MNCPGKTVSDETHTFPLSMWSEYQTKCSYQHICVCLATTHTKPNQNMIMRLLTVSAEHLIARTDCLSSVVRRRRVYSKCSAKCSWDLCGNVCRSHRQPWPTVVPVFVRSVVLRPLANGHTRTPPATTLVPPTRPCVTSNSWSCEAIAQSAVPTMLCSNFRSSGWGTTASVRSASTTSRTAASSTGRDSMWTCSRTRSRCEQSINSISDHKNVIVSWSIYL